MTNKPTRLAAASGVIGAAAIAALTIFTEPALAQNVDAIEELLFDWRIIIIRLLQAALTIVMAYSVGMMGMNGPSGVHIKKLAMSLVAFVILEMFNQMILAPIQDVGEENGDGSDGTVDAVGGVDPSAAASYVQDSILYTVDMTLAVVAATPL